MTDEAYDSLLACARRRLAEWDLSPREMRVIEVLADLSFGQRQAWACIVGLEDLATVCRLDKGDLSRTLAQLVDRGALQRRDETGAMLFALCPFSKSMPLKSRVRAATQDELDARARLIVVQRRRLNGAADANGQGRLPMALDATREDHAAPEMALKAMLEEALTDDLGIGRRAAVGGPPMAVGGPPMSVGGPPTGPPPILTRARNVLTLTSTDNVKRLTLRMGALKRENFEEIVEDTDGFDAAQADVWRMLCEAMQTGSKRGWQSFLQHERFWRREIRTDSIMVFNAIGEYRLRCDGKLGPHSEPGWVITGQMKRMGWVPPRKRLKQVEEVKS